MSRIIMALAALALPSLALAQTPEQRIENALERARAAGIPVSLLEWKIADGTAKGVSLDRIAAAVEKRGAGLERARLAISARGPSPSEQELDMAVSAMDLGVSTAVLQKLSETSGGERRAAALAALTQLVAKGSVPTDALERVTDALERGGDALTQLPEESAAARARRGPPTGIGGTGARPGMGGPPAGLPASGRPAPLGRPAGG